MRDVVVATDWASARRRRWSASRIAAAVALHALVLTSLSLAIDRVDMPRQGRDRATTLVTVTLHAAPPPLIHDLPRPRARPPEPAQAGVQAPRAHDAPARPRASEDAAQAITLPAPARVEPVPEVAAATPPASSPRPDLSFLDNAATRQAIRNVARGDTLASAANAATHEDDGSELLAADGSHAGTLRNLPPPPPAQLLAKNVAAAHKGDCGKGEYLGGGMGLLSAPFLIAAEAMGNCSSK
jgi:hypothetical protein